MMRTVNEVSKLTGVSIRTLQYYDKIGLLKPTGYTQAGYRLYDDTALEKLQQITLLTLKKEHLENLIDLARGIKKMGVKHMDFSAFDTKKIDEYDAQAKATWGTTDEYHEYEDKAKGRTAEQQKSINIQMMNIFAEFGEIRDGDPASEQAQNLVKKLQDFITKHFYTCTNEILASLGKMYVDGGDFTANIDKAGGVGTAEFVDKAIEIYCR